eukprot:scaffold4704_cov116-Isochrysis_galbana.AAC.1
MAMAGLLYCGLRGRRARGPGSVWPRPRGAHPYSVAAPQRPAAGTGTGELEHRACRGRARGGRPKSVTTTRLQSAKSIHYFTHRTQSSITT